MANFTPQEIEQFLQQFFDVVGARQYVGARYVPIFGRAGSDTVEWDDTAPYEPLTVVMHEGVSYVSRRYVPAGIAIDNTDYWAQTYRFNAQVEQYRQEVLTFQGQIDGIRDTMESDYVPFPDYHTYPKYGTLGQVLTTLSDGTTKWENPIVPSDEQSEEVITAWLNDHPEATTTVQDGSITNVKIHDNTIEDSKLVQTGGILETVSNIENALATSSGYVVYDDFAGAHDGYFINYGGTVAQNSNYTYTQPISVNAGAIINFVATGYQQSIAMISLYNNGSYTPKVISIDSTEQLYTYTADSDQQIVLCYRTANRHICTIISGVSNLTDSIDDLEDRVLSLEGGDTVTNYDFSDAVNGYYIDYGGNVSANPSFSYSQPFEVVEGDEIVFTATGYQQSVAMISQYEAGRYTLLVRSIDSTQRDYTYTVPYDMKIALCYRTVNPHICKIYSNTLNQINYVNDKINSIIETETLLDFTRMFRKIGGVGDSLMSGELIPNGYTSKDTRTVSWLTQLSKIGSFEAEHFSTGGMTTLAWLNDVGGYRSALENAQTACDAYFIALGTNDKNQTAYPMGNITDTAGTASFVGYYKQIIEIIHAKNSHAPIFCLSMYDRLSPSLPYSNIVSQISALYAYCYFVDFATNTEHTPKTTDAYAQNSHYTTIGYLYASELINKLICEIINANKTDFMWTQYDWS